MMLEKEFGNKLGIFVRSYVPLERLRAWLVVGCSFYSLLTTCYLNFSLPITYYLLPITLTNSVVQIVCRKQSLLC